MMEKPKVLVGMSGGVDSSYAAAFLQQQGYEVTGVMLNLWTEPSQDGENRCCSIDSQYLARRLADQLSIPFYVVDAKEVFRAAVVDEFIAGYIRGVTPNPCIFCNARVRWKVLLQFADRFGIEKIATGHYARITQSSENNPQLQRGLDVQKDQSYVLSMLNCDVLTRTILPLGGMSKQDVRKNSRTLNLASSDRPDSQDLCFLGKMNYRDFLRKYAPAAIQPGEIVNDRGELLGRHEGLPFYTIGQRKGLRIADAQPYHVIHKDVSTNRLIVGHRSDFKNTPFTVAHLNWLEKVPEGEDFECGVQVRYRSTELPAIVRTLDLSTANVEIHSREPAGVTPGQLAAFYRGSLCLGAGVIV